MIDVQEKLDEDWIRCHTVIEIAGRPKEHVEKTIENYLGQIKEDEGLEIINSDLNEAQEKETEADNDQMVEKLWSSFAEIDMMVEDPVKLGDFCINYMPASLEVVEPDSINYSNQHLTEFFNNLQSRLHQLDMKAKQLKNQNDFLNNNISSLLRNYVQLLLKDRKLTSEEISNFTGVDKSTVEDFMDKLIDEGRVQLEGERYILSEDED